MEVKKKILVEVLVVLGLILLVFGGGIYLSLREKKSENVVKMAVQGDSMEPTLKAGQEVLVDKDYYKTNALRKGDIVAVAFQTTNTQYVKRVIAVEGDRVEFKGSSLLINGQPLAEEYLKDQDYQIPITELKILQIQLQKYGKIPQGSFLALSDNRSRAHDSRKWGLLSTNQILGKVISY